MKNILTLWVALSCVSALWATVPLNRAIPVTFGRDSKGGNALAGRFLDARVASRVWTDAEIAAYANAPDASISPAGLVWQGVPKIGERCEAIRQMDCAHGFTFACWVILDRTGGRLLDNVTPGRENGILIDTWPNRLRAQFRALGTISHAEELACGKKQCLVVTYDEKNEAKMWLNGKGQFFGAWQDDVPPYASGKVEWKFPLYASQQGLAFSDAVTGILVWGSGSTLNLTVGRADLWDHRGGYSWTSEQSYTNIVDAAQKGDRPRLHGLFRKTTPPGEPRNPTLMPLGRVVLELKDAELLRGSLNPFTGLGEIVVRHQGAEKTLLLAMGKTSRAFTLRLPEGVAYTPTTKHWLEFPGARAAYGRYSHVPAVKRAWDGRTCGFTWRMPADPSVRVDCFADGRDFTVRTVRGEEQPAGFVSYDRVKMESRAQWTAFWKEGAHVTVPDPVLQRQFDYGMYRFGAMTDPDGIPPGLQGGWLEDDNIIMWSGDYHFNINVQEIFSPAYRGGHPKNLLPLFRMMRTWWPRLRENARLFCGVTDGFSLPHSVDDRGTNIGGFWTGTIDHGSTAWSAQMMYDYAHYAQDRAFLASDAYPFMKGAMKVYRAMMVERDGRLSFPIGPSPEWFGGNSPLGIGRDPSFQLAAAHRLARNLIVAAKTLGEAPDPMWLDVERRLPLASMDAEKGILVFEGTPLTESHRHHSHMAGLYPFDIFDLADAATARTVARTFDNWRAQGTSAWTGWCVPWAAVLCVHGGYPDEACKMLHTWERYFTDKGHASLCDASRPGFTQYTTRFDPEGRPLSREVMVMDGSSAATTAIMEMMVHEVNGKTEFFRGCPAAWKDVSFTNIRLSDGRAVSGRRHNGKIEIWPADHAHP